MRGLKTPYFLKTYKEKGRIQENFKNHGNVFFMLNNAIFICQHVWATFDEIGTTYCLQFDNIL